MLVGETVTLRHLKGSDIDELAPKWNNMKSSGEYLPTAMRSPHRLRKQFEEDGFSSETSELLAIIIPGGTVAGVVSHFQSTKLFSERELGYRIFDVENRNRGYTTEAIGLLVEYLFSSFEFNRLRAQTDARNAASGRVVGKHGFSKEGTIREAMFVRGHYVDVNVYGLLRREWETARSSSPLRG